MEFGPSPINQLGLAARRVFLALRDEGADAAKATLREAVASAIGVSQATRDDLAQRLMTYERPRLLVALGARSDEERKALGAGLDDLFAEALRLVDEDPGETPHQIRRRGFYRYRLGDFEGALPELERSYAELETAFGAFYFAMVRARLGDPAEARRWHDEGVQLFAGTTFDPTTSYVYSATIRVRQEADEVLGIDRSGR